MVKSAVLTLIQDLCIFLSADIAFDGLELGHLEYLDFRNRLYGWPGCCGVRRCLFHGCDFGTGVG